MRTRGTRLCSTLTCSVRGALQFLHLNHPCKPVIVFRDGRSEGFSFAQSEVYCLELAALPRDSFLLCHPALYSEELQHLQCKIGAEWWRQSKKTGAGIRMRKERGKDEEETKKKKKEEKQERNLFRK